MKKSFSKLILSPLTVLVLASFAMAPVAEARGGGGGGARAGGGGAHAGGGGNRQVNNSNRDVRANNVRSTSVNNVNNRNTNINANKNVNVNVNNNRGGCCGGGWDNDYHPVATAAAVTAAAVVTSAVVGSMVRTVPAGCVPVNYGGMIYQQCGSTWYQPQGSQYVVINPPY
ncbi:MAG: hypothetical protein JNM42_02260 [Propionivibrio sp.]|uniref:hypothetical protein n=1 Tax=Propionivibrio sp. TaxID=2212460 RepID=UPI001A49820E|nr:hypothetical protein [Propionivibrio sp.]MBL8413242.1 hypothetical protein [Propionivibrio sp.]